MHHKSDTQTFCRKRVIEFFDNSSEMPLKKGYFIPTVTK